MSNDAVLDEFFDGLSRAMRKTSLGAWRTTKNGMDLYTARDGAIKVTANYAPTEPRVSVKLTVNRGRVGGANPLFDYLREQYEDSNELDGHIEWTSPPDKKESKVEVSRVLLDERDNWPDQFKWIAAEAPKLKHWADEIKHR